MSPAYIPALALTNKSFTLVLPSFRFKVYGMLGAYEFPGFIGEEIVVFGMSGCGRRGRAKII